MGSSTTDLLNTDYIVGIPVTYRHGTLATRLRLFHQSSHLGDEYMAHTHAQRVDLTFQAVDLLVAHQAPTWRAYGGGGYVFAHSPADLRPGVLHGGFEYRQARSWLRLGRSLGGRLVAGLDAKSIQDRQGQGGWGLLTRVHVRGPFPRAGARARLNGPLQGFTGPAASWGV